jgi:DNA polymerase-3 subunit beta
VHVDCLQENLNRGLGIVGRAVATRTTLPITQNIMIQTDEGRIKLSATNLDLAISTWIGAKVENEGAITVPARLFSEFVGSLPSEPVSIKVAAGAHILELECAKSQARIAGTDAEEFPIIPEVQGGVRVLLQPQVLRTAIAQVVFAAATEDSRPVLTGIKIELEGNNITLASADGFRLAVYKGTLDEAIPEPTQAIVPARALNELHRLLSDQEDPIEMLLDPAKGQVLFRLKDVEVISQLIQGAFPNYAQLIPENSTTRTKISVQEFSRAARSAAIFARDGNGIIRLHILPGEPGSIQVIARAEEIGESTMELTANVEGEEAKVAFNSRYLTDVLSAISQDHVSLEVTTPSSPGMIRPVGSDDYIHVIMPMFVQW